jgi:hypothetical protein
MFLIWILLWLIAVVVGLISLACGFFEPTWPLGKRSAWVAVVIGVLSAVFTRSQFGVGSSAWRLFFATPALFGAGALLVSRVHGNCKRERIRLGIASALVGSFLVLILVLSCQPPGPIDHPGLIFNTKIALVFLGVVAGVTAIAAALTHPDSVFATRAGWGAICCGVLFGLFTWAVDPVTTFWNQSPLIAVPIVPGVVGIGISWLLPGRTLRVVRAVVVAATIVAVIFGGNSLLLGCVWVIATCMYDENIDFLQSPQQAARHSPSETELKLIGKTRLDFQKSARLLYHAVDNFDGYENWLLLCPTGTHPVDSVKGQRVESFGIPDTNLPVIKVHLQTPDVGKLSPEAGTPWFVRWTSDGDWTADVTPTDRGDYIDLVRNWDARGLRPQPVAKPQAEEPAIPEPEPAESNAE